MCSSRCDGRTHRLLSRGDKGRIVFDSNRRVGRRRFETTKEEGLRMAAADIINRLEELLKSRELCKNCGD